ncbi:MAG: hypothetical protein FD138_788 [Planctomycetota bacterium]|nr:MAG: hypothetical protein FD138_788 [Planctomycetota bacterium]
MATWLTWAIDSLRRAAWAPILVFTIQLVAILVFDIYARFPDFDIPMHVVGGVAIAYFFGACYRTAAQRELLGQPSAVVFPPMILGLTCLAAVVWEFAEFAVEQWFGIITQPSLADTLLDLLLGLLGGVIWIAWNRRPV